jgi:hypothetical protein
MNEQWKSADQAYECLKVEHLCIVQRMRVMVLGNDLYVEIDGQRYKLHLMCDDVWTTGC